jgi:hypothetical protein
MSFNKRHFNQESIQKAAKAHDFDSFRAYLLKPDLCFFEDDLSHRVWNTFNSEDSSEMKLLYEKLKYA